MPTTSKCYEFLGLIDPYKEFVLVERLPALLLLRTFMLILCGIGFIVYAAFAVLSFALTPDPTDLFVTRIFPSKPPQALFQFSFGIPVDGSIPDFLYPTRYISPFSDTLTSKRVMPYLSRSRVPKNLNIPDNTMTYQIFTFPVYGTLDANTSSSIILLFEPLKYTNDFNFPLLFFVGPPSTKQYSNLDVQQFSPRDYRVSLPGNPTQFVLIFEDFNDRGQEIAISLVLSKFVSSKDEVTYNASIFGAPSLSAASRALGAVDQEGRPIPQKQRTISVSINPVVNVINHSPKNILAFVGSVVGIFPLILGTGGIFCSIIWSQFGRKNKDSFDGEGGKVAMNAIQGTPA